MKNVKITRNINWLPSIDINNFRQIDELQDRLVIFYSNNENNYYDRIDFTKNYWKDLEEIAYDSIVKDSFSVDNICEIGCGSANILSEYPELAKKYFGCDFSKDLIEQNGRKYPQANFKLITDSKRFPYENNVFDLVFSVFVLEHVTTPHIFLNECHRILKPNGKLIILCPDYLGRGRMISQRSGFSNGSTSEKFKKLKFLDAIITFFDNKIKIPLYCYFKRITFRKPIFLINVTPTVFTDSFVSDVDAVYVTFRKEIIEFLMPRMSELKNSNEMRKYEKKRKWIFLKFIKN